MTSLLNLFKRKCVYKGCSKNREKGNEYCIFHKPSVTDVLLESGIAKSQIVEILQYAGEYSSSNLDIQTVINKDLRPIIQWYGERNFKPLFSQLPESQIQYVVDVYNHRFPDGSVDPDYVVQLDANSGKILQCTKYYKKRNNDFFDPYIFFSELYIFDDAAFEKAIKGYIWERNNVFNELFEFSNSIFTIGEKKDNISIISDSFKKYTGKEICNSDVLMCFIDSKEFKENKYFINGLIYNEGFVQFEDKPDSENVNISIHRSIAINKYPHSRYFQYSTPCISVNYIIHFTEKITKIHSGTFYNVFQMWDGWRIITFSSFMEKFLTYKYAHNIHPTIKFNSNCKAWFNELITCVDEYNKDAYVVLHPYDVKCYKPMMDNVSNVLNDLGEEKFKDEIESHFKQSSKILIESTNARLFNGNISNFGEIKVDEKWIYVGTAIEMNLFH
jgi:hypothetical protein